MDQDQRFFGQTSLLLTSGWPEILQAVGKGIQNYRLDRLAISLVLYAEINNQQAQHTQRKRKHHGIFEYFIRKMTEIYEHAQSSEDQESAPIKKDREQHQPKIDEAVEELIQLTAALHEGEASPES